MKCIWVEVAVILWKGGDGKDEWIFDVDDTSFSTMSYFESHGFVQVHILVFCFYALEQKAWDGSCRTWLGLVTSWVEPSLPLFCSIRHCEVFKVTWARILERCHCRNRIKVGYYGRSGLILRYMYNNIIFLFFPIISACFLENILGKHRIQLFRLLNELFQYDMSRIKLCWRLEIQ